MSKRYRIVDESCLIVRNFPPAFTERDIREFLYLFDPARVCIFEAFQTAFAEFQTKQHAADILKLVHQHVLDGYRLFVEYAPKNHNEYVALCSQTFYASLTDSNVKEQMENAQNCSTCSGRKDDDDEEVTEAEVDEALKQLFGIAPEFGVNQPPPPYLKYEYPLANRDIIDAISIALESIPEFYIQVCDLMNRMNLEPPFVPGDKRLVYASSKKSKPEAIAVGTQTDEISWQNLIRSKRKHLESGESELESSSAASQDEEKAPKDVRQPKQKRQKTHDSDKMELIKQKQRNKLKMERLQKQNQPTTSVAIKHKRVSDAFEVDANKMPKNIRIIVPEQLVASTSETVENFVERITGKTSAESHDQKLSSSYILSDAEISENRIPAEQLKEHPLFQSYDAGEITNRLYVKNIAKDVTEADLRAIYERYLEQNCGGHGNVRSLDIRLMTSGRMKGQAFIQFDGPYLNCDVDDEASMNLPNKYQMIEKALRETNGLIVKTKPLVVVYGKKKTN